MVDPLLEVENLRKSFGGIQAVDGASLSIEEGSITGLIGPNGAGKTTMFNVMSGFFHPDAGVVRFEGQDLQDIMRPSRPIEQAWRVGATSIVIALLGVIAVASTGAGSAVFAPVGIACATIGAVGYKFQERIRETRLNHRYTRPFRVAESGLVRTFQITRELKGLTVRENLMLAPKTQPGENILRVWWPLSDARNHESAVRERVDETLELLESDHLADELARNLSGGQQKLLELGRVLMADPDLVLLDEPVAGVNPVLTRKILDRINDLRKKGYTFVIIEHDMEVVMGLSDKIIVMDQGDILMTGTPEEVRNDPRVIDAYLGR